MNQSNEFSDSDPFSSPPPPTTYQPDSAPEILALPPLATYPSREALFEAIQSWAKLHGYAFVTGKSKKVPSGLQKVYYACEQGMEERLKKQGESSRKERAIVARALLQPNSDIYNFDLKKLTFWQAIEGREKDK